MKTTIKTAIFVTLVALPGFGNAQQKCYGLLETGNNFLKVIDVAQTKIKAKKYTNADANSMKESFVFYENYFTKNISRYTDFMEKCLRLQCYAVYSSILYQNGQYSDLENLADKAFTTTDDISFYGDPPCVTCVTMGDVQTEEEDEETGEITTKTIYTTNGSFDFTELMYKKYASWLFENIAYAAYHNGNNALRNKFLLKAFDKYFFKETQSSVSLRLAHDILTADNETATQPDDLIFAAATIYLMQHSDKTANGANISQTDKKIYQKATDLLKKGDFVFSNNKTKDERYYVNKKKTSYYFFAVRNMVNEDIASPEDQAAILKQLISNFYKSDKVGMPYKEIPQILPSEKSKLENLTAAIIKDNDRNFMADLADVLYSYYMQWGSYTHQDEVKAIVALYNAAGKKSKAEKTAKLLH